METLINFLLSFILTYSIITFATYNKDYRVASLFGIVSICATLGIAYVNTFIF